MHRKSSDSSHSAAVSYYSGTESQQSVSDRSFYDNVFEQHHHHHHHHHIGCCPHVLPLPPHHNINSHSSSSNNNNNNNGNRHYTKARNYLMPPINNSLRNNHPHVNVNRSVSFQETCVGGESRTLVLPSHRPNIIIVRRRGDMHESASEIDSNRSSVSPSDSSPSKTNVECVEAPNEINLVDFNKRTTIDRPFYLKLLRRMQKISSFWRKRQVRKTRRGRLLLTFMSFVVLNNNK